MSGDYDSTGGPARARARRVDQRLPPGILGAGPRLLRGTVPGRLALPPAYQRGRPGEMLIGLSTVKYYSRC